jgi:hypothetical protein
VIQKKHLKWIIVIGLITILVIGVWNPFEIIYNLDQSNEASQTGYILMDSTTQDTYPTVGQGFQMSVPVAGNVNWVSFSASRSGVVTGVIKVQIWRDNWADPKAPDVLLKTYELTPLIITGSISWINVPINCTYANMGAGFIVLDFSQAIFSSGSYVRVYHSGNSYHVDDDWAGLWSGLWKRNTNNAWSVDMSKDLRFKAYRGLIRCWKCSGTTAVSQDFGWGTVCGSGSAADYTYTTQPTCSGGENNPPICTDIIGPTEGLIGEEYEFTVYGNDPDGDSIQYKVDWDDGTVSPYQSSPTFMHIFWQSEQYFSITARVKDEHGAESTWSMPLTIFISEEVTNNPPVCNEVTGPTTGSIGVSYQFMANAVDPDEDPLQYFFDWGDTTDSGWIDTSVASKSWGATGTYGIMAKARDDSGLESAFCAPIQITITEDGGDLYSIIFTVIDRGSGLPLADATVAFNSETKTSDANGNAVFSGVLSGTMTASVTKDSYKPLTGNIVVDESKTMYALMASTSESYDSVFSDSPSPPDGGISEWYILIALVIIGIIGTIIAIRKAPVSMKIGIPVILWIIIAILYLLFYGGVI